MSDPAYTLTDASVRKLQKLMRTVKARPDRPVMLRPQISAASVGVAWIKVTGAINAQSRYPALVETLTPNTFTDWTGAPVVELYTTVTRSVGDVVPAVYCGDSASTSKAIYAELTTMIGAYPGGGGGSIEVRDVSGTHDYPGTTILQFNQAIGFLVTNPSGMTAQVSMSAAGISTPGYVTAGTQTIWGAKTFGFVITASAGVTTGAGQSYAWTNGALGSASITSNGYSTSPFGGASEEFLTITCTSNNGGAHSGVITLWSNGLDFGTTPLMSGGNQGVASHTVTLAKLTGGGANGSMTVTNGLVTAITDPT